MRVTVYLSDGSQLDIEEMPDGDALELREGLSYEQPGFLTFDMDGATVLVNRAHLARVDFETGD